MAFEPNTTKGPTPPSTPATRGFTNETIEIVNPVSRPAPQIVAHDPIWALQYRLLSTLIRGSLAATNTLITIDHVGSTSIPHLAAKPIIDIDITVTSLSDEPSYAPQLENLGFTLFMRQPRWYEHRMFVMDTPLMAANLHVFPSGCPEVKRHIAMRDWLSSREGVADRSLYEAAKMAASRETLERGEDSRAYNVRKEGTLLEILGRACVAFGVEMA